MPEAIQKMFKVALTVVLVFQLAGCGTLLYPERRNQQPVSGHLDMAVFLLDAVGLFFFIIPGVIAFAVDLSTGCIYLPAYRPPEVNAHVVLKKIYFDPKHITVAQLERIIHDQTGKTVHLNQGDVRISRLNSRHDMMDRFAMLNPSLDSRLAFNK